GIAGRPMSLNGYSWVEGNMINAVDPSGMNPVNQKANYYVTIRAYADALDLCLRGDEGVCNSLPVVHGITNSKSIPDNQVDALAMVFDYAAGYHTLATSSLLVNIVASELFGIPTYVLPLTVGIGGESRLLRFDSGPNSGFHPH